MNATEENPALPTTANNRHYIQGIYEPFLDYESMKLGPNKYFRGGLLASTKIRAIVRFP